jgi:predicted nucleic acid-binding protein
MTDGPLVYLDANPFIYGLERASAISAPIKTLSEALRAGPGAGITSGLTLAEVLAPTKGRKRTPQLKRAYLDLMVWSHFIDLQPISRGILYETVNLRATRATAKLKLPDAIHLATAIRGRCRFFVSGDKGIPVPRGMIRAKPDASSVADIIRVLE